MIYNKRHFLLSLILAVLLCFTAGHNKASAAHLDSFTVQDFKSESNFELHAYLLCMPLQAIYFMQQTEGMPSRINLIQTCFGGAYRVLHVMANLSENFYTLYQSPSEGNNLTTAAQPKPESLLKDMWNRFVQSPLKVKVLVVILAYLLLSVVVLFVSIVINRQLKSIKRIRIRELKNEYQEQLASFLFDDEIDRIEFRGINKKLNRQIFIDELMDLHSNLHGEAAEKLRDMYFNLGLYKDSLQKANNRKWHKKAKGFSELAKMDVKDANKQIQKHVNHKNPILRMQAQVSMVKLAEENPLGFLDELENELSYWEQINIYDTLVYHQINIDSFEQWLDHSNPSVSIFALRMIELFKHVHSAPKVREMLFHDNPEISLAAINALKALEIAEYADDLKILYDSETHRLLDILNEQRKSKKDKEIESLDDILPRKIRFEILEALEPIASEQDIPFLEKVMIDNENSYKIRLLAIKILLSLPPQGEAKVDDIFAHEDTDELTKKMIINVKQHQES